MSTDNQSAQSEREAFEAWAVKTHGNRTLSDPDIGSMWSAWKARSALAQAPAPSGEAPEGWALVPKEPTEAMKKAGGHANSEWLNDNAPIGEARYAMPMESVWREMIAAAPKGASK